MQEAPSSLHDRLAPSEEIFFTWLMRVFAAATLVGSAGLDDAPPLEMAALVIAIYVAIRVASQFGNFVSVGPFPNRVLNTVFAIGSLALLASAFVIIAIFVGRLAALVAG